MAIRLIPGMRFLLKTDWFVVREILQDHQFLLENLFLGGKIIYSGEKLAQAFAQGELQFEVVGKHRPKDDFNSWQNDQIKNRNEKDQQSNKELAYIFHSEVFNGYLVGFFIAYESPTYEAVNELFTNIFTKTQSGSS